MSRTQQTMATARTIEHFIELQAAIRQALRNDEYVRELVELATLGHNIEAHARQGMAVEAARRQELHNIRELARRACIQLESYGRTPTLRVVNE